MDAISEIRKLVKKERLITKVLEEGKPQVWYEDYEPTGQEAIRTRITLGTKLREASNNGYANNEEIKKYSKQYTQWVNLCPYE